MTTLETTTHSHQADIDSLNERISRRLDSANPLMSHIVMSLLRTKGKQLRPLMLIMCAKIFGQVSEKVLAAASAVELLHNASLIHDDVVDNSMTRRNRPTVNAIWDNHIAVLVGDFLHPRRCKRLYRQATSALSMRCVTLVETCRLAKSTRSTMPESTLLPRSIFQDCRL